MEHFTQAAGNFVKCKHCSAKLAFVSRHTHLSSLTKHLKAKHSEVLSKPDEEPVSKVSRIGDYYTPPHATFPALPSIDRQAIAACSSNHALPFSLVEDPVFQWAYSVKCVDRHKLSERVTSLAQDWRLKVSGLFFPF